MKYQELHTYITTIQAIINSMYPTQTQGLHLKLLMEIRRLTDLEIGKQQ